MIQHKKQILKSDLSRFYIFLLLSLVNCYKPENDAFVVLVIQIRRNSFVVETQSL